MSNSIVIKGARENNLKNIDISIPKCKLVVITGLSGSGKSSLAFDTIYAEGQRRYVESLSTYARQFLQVQDKPDVEYIEGLSPTIAINQKTIGKSPRSTVATITEIYDYLRLLFARIGIPYSPKTGKPITSQSSSQIVNDILKLPIGTAIYILAPIVRGRKGEYLKELDGLQKNGYSRIKLNNVVYNIEEVPKLDKNKKHNIEVVVDRLTIKEGLGNRLPSSIETALRLGEGVMQVELVDVENPQIITFSEKFACPETGFTLAEIEPRLFSFNSPYGACKKCSGLGKIKGFDLDKILPDHNLSLSEGVIAPLKSAFTRSNPINKFYHESILELAKQYNFSLNTPWKDLKPEIQTILLRGVPSELNHTRRPNFPGIIGYLKEIEQKFELFTEKYKSLTSCEACGGNRLCPEALCVKIDEQHIGEISDLSITDAKEWISTLKDKITSQQIQIATKVLQEITNRLTFLLNIGLSYLKLNRESGTLSGGESQRIRLASQIGSGLTGVIYVLDEPSIGLHQCDNDKLIETLKRLRDLPNSIIVVEHDEDTILSSDYLIDIGPGAGLNGGKVVAEGTPQEIKNNPNSITGLYLSNKMRIEVPKVRREGNGKVIVIEGATLNNLKNVDAIFPLGKFICVTGVSGGGKSSLVIQTLYKILAQKLNDSKEIPGPYKFIEGIEFIDKAIEIDQSPIGRTPLSNPGTYTGVFNYIRDWFTMLPESRARGYQPGRFSFNVKGGRCEPCKGEGVLKIEMHFLPDAYVKCEKCHGKRYNTETLEITYKNKSIFDVLSMNVEEAIDFFANVPLIKEKLLSLHNVGLGYISIGQSSINLSGGEAQRVKLSKELSKRSTGKTLYILDEPTTGLHIHDIKNLLEILHKLVEKGNTVIVIEHNLHVIKTADYIIDIGPEGGINGGKIIALGTPEEVVNNPNSVTGKYLKQYL